MFVGEFHIFVAEELPGCPMFRSEVAEEVSAGAGSTLEEPAGRKLEASTPRFFNEDHPNHPTDPGS